MRLLLVEDDRMIAENRLDGLLKSRYAVDWARSGPEADIALATTPYDLLLLDLGLPGKQGIDVLRALPVLVRRAGLEPRVLQLNHAKCVLTASHQPFGLP